MSPIRTLNIPRVLAELPLLANLAAEHVGELARAARASVVQREQAIYRVGDEIGELFILHSGQVKLALSCTRGNEHIIDIVEPGSAFGEAELFGQRPCVAGAVAVRTSQVIGIEREALQDVMAREPRLALRLTRLLARRQVELEADVAERHLLSGGQRVLEYLVRLAGPARDAIGETTVMLGSSKQLLAARFSMQPETFSRTLRDLADSGFIVPDLREIRLMNAAIERYLAADPADQTVMVPSRRRLREATLGRADARGGGRSRVGEPRTLCDSINTAGRQRMLSQRLAKSWLMLQRGVMARRSRLILRQSMDMFDGQLKELDVLASDAGCRAARTELAEGWQTYRELLGRSPDSQTARELFAVSEEVLAAAHRLTVAFEHAEGTRKGELVNFAGRQRMQSQRMAKLYLFGQIGIRSATCRRELEAASEEFGGGLSRLIAATADNAAIRAELEPVAERWDGLRNALALVDDRNSTVNARGVFKASEEVLRHLDAAVGLCARSAANGDQR